MYRCLNAPVCLFVQRVVLHSPEFGVSLPLDVASTQVRFDVDLLPSIAAEIPPELPGVICTTVTAACSIIASRCRVFVASLGQRPPAAAHLVELADAILLQTRMRCYISSPIGGLYADITGSLVKREEFQQVRTALPNKLPNKPLLMRSPANTPVMRTTYRSFCSSAGRARRSAAGQVLGPSTEAAKHVNDGRAA